MKALHLNSSGDLRIQRSFFCRKSAEHLEKLISKLLLQARQVCLGPDRRPLFSALVVLTPSHFSLILQVRCNARRLRGTWRENPEGLRWRRVGTGGSGHIDCTDTGNEYLLKCQSEISTVVKDGCCLRIPISCTTSYKLSQIHRITGGLNRDSSRLR